MDKNHGHWWLPLRDRFVARKIFCSGNINALLPDLLQITAQSAGNLDPSLIIRHSFTFSSFPKCQHQKLIIYKILVLKHSISRFLGTVWIKWPNASEKVIYQAIEKSQNPYYQSDFYHRKTQFKIHHIVDTQPSIAY